MADLEMGGELITFDDIEVKGVFSTLEDGSVTVEGSLQVVAHSRCANCLAPAQAVITNSFRETFVRGGDPEDDEIFTYDGYLVDLDKLLMTFTVLALPMRFLCKEDCEGLGAYAGPDDDVSLYREDEAPQTQHPFAGLRQLLDQQSSDGENPEA